MTRTGSSTRKLTALVVDDEPLARRRVCQLLEPFDDIVVLGECATGTEAVASIRSQQPDLVFLDIQMPELDGFAVLDMLPEDQRPFIVFVTAHDEYAVRAFEGNAIDYLLKPIDADRFKSTMQRVRERINLGQHAHQESTNVLQAILAERRRPRQFAVTTTDGTQFVQADDIEYVEAAGKHVRLCLKDGASVSLRFPIGKLEDLLDSAQFARIHRSSIIRLSEVKRVEPLFRGEMLVVMSSGAELTVSRGYRGSFKERFGGTWK